MQTINKTIPCITSDGRGASFFSTREITLNGDSSWMLSDQQQAINFRLRSSASPYESTWHVAGDPTLLIILSGELEIELRSGKSQIFSAGDMFIAEDYLSDGVEFNSNVSGHRARVLGGDVQALHLKLEKR